MLKKGSSSRALSSTTAKGFLPQYSGFASRALSPGVSVPRPTSPNWDVSPGKVSVDLDLGIIGVPLTPVPEKRENRRPNGEDDQFRRVVPMDISHGNNVSSTFNL
jgi:hypothetical protein